LYQKRCFLGEKVQAGTCSWRNDASASWYKLVTSSPAATTSPPSDKTACRRVFTGGFFYQHPFLPFFYRKKKLYI
jgi:hypothetical protein